MWKIHIYLNDTDPTPKYEYEFYNMTLRPEEDDDLLVGGLNASEQEAYDWGLADYQALIDSEPRINDVIVPGSLQKPFKDEGGFDSYVQLDENDNYPYRDENGQSGRYVATDSVNFRFRLANPDGTPGGDGLIPLLGAVTPSGDKAVEFDSGSKYVKLNEQEQKEFLDETGATKHVQTTNDEYPFKDENSVSRYLPVIELP